MAAKRAGGAASGQYARLAPVYATLPMGYNGTRMAWDASAGEFTGTTVNTTEPTWAVTDTTLTDSGNAATNRTNLQSLVTSYASGATGNTKIVIPAGALFAGTITLKSNATGFWIGLVTSGTASLPTPSTGTSYGTSANRVTPSHATYMPELYATGTNLTVIETESGAKKYYLRGLYLTNRGAYVNDGTMVNIRNYPTYPEDITFAQCLEDGGSATYALVKRSYLLSGIRLAVVDGYADRIGSTGNDSQHVAIVNGGAGPYKYANCYSKIGGNCENIIVMGTYLDGTDESLLPSDIEVRGCRMDRPSAYGGHKPYFEVKGGRRILFHNITGSGHNGGGQQYGVIIKISIPYPAGYGTESPPGTLVDTYNQNMDVSDIVLHSVRFEGEYSTIALYDHENYVGSNHVRNIDIKNCSFTRPLGYNYALSFSRGLANVDAQWNTLIGKAAGSYGIAMSFDDAAYVLYTPGGAVGGNTPAANTVVVKNNVMVSGDVGNGLAVIESSSGTYGYGEAIASSAWGSSVTITKNLVTSGTGAANYANNLRVADAIASCGFTATDGTNWSLASGVGKAGGDGGFDVGVDWSLLTTLNGAND